MLASHVLDRVNLGDENPGIGHEISAGLQFEAYPAARDPLGLETRPVPRGIIFGNIDLRFARPIGHGEAATGGDRLERPVGAPHGIQHAVADAMQVSVVDARADVHVKTDQGQPVFVDETQAVLKILMPDSMLARWTARIGLAVMAMSKAGIDPEPHRMAASRAAELPQHVGRSAIDRNSQFPHARQRRLVDDVGRERDFMRGCPGV